MHVTRRLLSHAAKDNNNARSIPALLQFLRVQNRLEEFQGHQGFGHFLGLTVATSTKRNDDPFHNVVEQDLRWETTSKIPPCKPAVVYRYKLPDWLKYLNMNDKTERKEDTEVRLATYMSILDEVTTWSMILETFPHPRPGVSVTMSTEWGPAAQTFDGSAVDIVTILTKSGKTVGFLRSEVRDPETSQVICHFQHTKFLDPGRMMRALLTPQGRWGMSIASERVLPMLSNSKTSQAKDEAEKGTKSAILNTFEVTGPSTASFQVRPQHTNGFGGLHGGVQAILMENLGHLVVKQHIDGIKNLTCKRIFVSYQSSASKKIKLQAHILNSEPGNRTVTVRVTCERDKEGLSVLVSEGVLEFNYEKDE